MMIDLVNLTEWFSTLTDPSDPREVGQKPVAAKEYQILMIEPAGTLKTGDAGGDRTRQEIDWICAGQIFGRRI